MAKKNTNIQPKAGYSPNIIALQMAAHDVPVFKEIRGKDYIYFGKKNEYPDYLLDLYNRSAKHNAIINGKCKYIFGKGVKNIGKEIVNSDNETFDEIIKKSILDIELFNGFYLEIIWDNGGNNIAELRHLCYSDVRSNKDNTEFYFTEEWTKTLSDGQIITNSQPQENKDWKVYKPYDENKKKGAQLFFYKAYRPGLKTYPLPEYQGSIVYIDIDVQIADYWNNAIHNGLSASHIINFYNGIPTEKEQQKLEEGFGKKLTGARSSKFVLNFADKKENGSDVQSLAPEDLDKHLQILNETVQQEIYAGHGIVNPMLFGIKTPGQLGGRTELIEANELFQNLYVNPKQVLIEELFSVVAMAKGIKGEIKLQKIEPIGFMFSESTMKEVLPEKAISEMIALRMGIDLSKYPEKKADISGDRLGKIPLALQQLGLAQARALESGDSQLADSIRVKMEELLGQLGEQTFSKKKNVEDKEYKLLEKFKEKGKKRGGFVIKKRPLEASFIKNLAQNEFDFIDFAKKEIKKDPSIIIINPLKPLIDARTGEPIGKIEVVYSYEWLSGYTDADLVDSRPFCIGMRELSKLDVTWTRQDIDSLENDMTDPDVQDVWESRGGWMTVKGTNVHLPSCRHIFVQKVIIS